MPDQANSVEDVTVLADKVLNSMDDFEPIPGVLSKFDELVLTYGKSAVFDAVDFLEWFSTWFQQ